MQIWMIPFLVVLFLWLVSLVRVGAAVDYNESGLLVQLMAGPIKFTVYPLRKMDRPANPQKKQRKFKAGTEPPPKKGGNLNLVKKFLPIATEAAGRFKQKIRIDSIVLDLVWGAQDPASAAMGYGWANAALGILWPHIEHNFTVRDRKILISVDFNASFPVITIRTVLSLTIGQILALGAVLGVKLIKLFYHIRKEKKLEEAV